MNSFFKVNGTFVNPDHLAGYLVSVISFAFGIYKFMPGKEGAGKLIKYLALITFLACIFILPSLRIRSSWIAVLLGIGVIYLYQKDVRENLNKYFNSLIKKGAAILLLAVITVSTILLLYKIKPASADGRLFIWKITSRMIKENPIWGIGFDRYGSEYGNYQADYFDDEGGSDYEKFISGNVKQAHNEYIQIWAELGTIGLLIWLGIIVSALWGYKKNDLPPPGILINSENGRQVGSKQYGVVSASSKVNNSITNLPKNFTQEFLSDGIFYALKISAKASLIALLAVGVFSFPLHILPTYINFIFFLSILSATVKPKIIFERSLPNYTSLAATQASRAATQVKTASAFIVVIIVSFIIVEKYKLFNAYQVWKEGYELASYGQYNLSLKEFEKVYPTLRDDGEFLFNYGGVLMLNNDYKNAAVLLEESKKNYLDPKQYTNLGACFEKMNEYKKAELNYKYAVNMEPNKIYTKYLLTKLYMKEKKYYEAKEECKSILNTNAKVETTAAQEIKDEIKNIIAELNNPALSGNN